MSMIKKIVRTVTPPKLLARLRDLRFRLGRGGMQGVFTEIHDTRHWECDESVSGAGSTLAGTREVRQHLAPLLHEFGVKVFLDAPCGDFHWMKDVDLGDIKYIGADIVAALIEQNLKQYRDPRHEFVLADISRADLPKADAIMCRDCLIHFSFLDARRAIGNFQRSGAKFFLSTTYTSLTENTDIVTGGWRPINLQLAPFNFPAPLKLISEQHPKYTDRSLGLWRMDSLPHA